MDRFNNMKAISDVSQSPFRKVLGLDASTVVVHWGHEKWRSGERKPFLETFSHTYSIKNFWGWGLSIFVFTSSPGDSEHVEKVLRFKYR